jgi:hypothetical protein
MQPGFQCSSILQKEAENILLLRIVNALSKCFASQAQILNPRPSLAGNAALNTDIPSSTVERLFFKLSGDTNSKRTKI